MSELNALHTTEAQAQLLENFQDSAKLKALLAAYVDQIQDIENALQPIIAARNIETMTGDRLDGLGSIVDVPRDGRTDEPYRLRIRAELAILKSQGIEPDIISILQLLLGMTTPDIAVDEYYPKTVFLRPRNFNVGSTDMETVAALLRRAKPAGTNLQVIYSTTETDDDQMFRYSDITGVPETSSTHGFGNGTLNGVS